MRDVIDAIGIKRVLSKVTVNFVLGVWAASLLFLGVFVGMFEKKPSYHMLVVPGMIMSFVAIGFAFLGHHDYNDRFGMLAMMYCFIALVWSIDGLRFAWGEVTSCRDLYNDQSAIASVQKSYADMIKTGTTQVGQYMFGYLCLPHLIWRIVSVHTLQVQLSTYSVAAYDSYMCLGVAYGSTVTRTLHTVLLWIMSLSSIACATIVIAMMLFQMKTMRKYGRQLGKTIQRMATEAKTFAEEEWEIVTHEKKN